VPKSGSFFWLKVVFMNWIETAEKKFNRERPELFTDFNHCEECFDHNETLSSSDVDKIGLRELGNPAWDPMCFITDQGYQYYFPAIIRLCINSTMDDYYIGQFLFQITYDGESNRHLRQLTDEQRIFVYQFCAYLLEEKIKVIHVCGDEDLLELAIYLWSS
jgi:hypothetical protein